MILAVVIGITSWTDVKHRKIYNKVLVPALVLSLIFHTFNDNLIESLKAMFTAFLLFFLVYMLRMTSAGDVKFFSVLGAIVADVQTMVLAFVIYAVFHTGLGLVAGLKKVNGNVLALLQLLKQDITAFVTKSGPVIEPIRFPAAIVIGVSVFLSIAIRLFT